MLVRVIAPHFVAGLVVGERAADIIRYMRTWPIERVRTYCRSKSWRCEVVE